MEDSNDMQGKVIMTLHLYILFHDRKKSTHERWNRGNIN
jgi:hypothetical protein